MSALQRIRIEDRLSFLRKFLTQPNLDEKVDHYHRQILMEEAQELEMKVPSNSLETEHEFA